MSQVQDEIQDSAAPSRSHGEVLHAARRLSFGPTPELVGEVEGRGVDGWIERQLNPGSIADPEVDQLLAGLSGLAATPAQARLTRGERVIVDLRLAAVIRATHSRRQLHELMVDLWHDRLVASAAKRPLGWFLPEYDRTAIRPHALGRFRDLLRAATTSGAMLAYLDTATSRAPDVNENHGRELLELHTVGPGYSESDVRGAAQVLSGWTIDRGTLRVRFDPALHHPGSASVMGWSTPGRQGSAAAADLLSLLDHLATHPSTARRVADLLARRFVSDDPPPALVESVAATYLAADTDIAATLRHLLATDEFRSSSSALLRRPFDLLAAQLRATGARLDLPSMVERLVPLGSITAGTGLSELLDPVTAPLLDATSLVDPLLAPLTDPLVSVLAGPRPISLSTEGVLRSAGQDLFMAPQPSGHPLTGPWNTGDALLRRWSLGALVAHDGLAGVSVDPGLLRVGDAAGATVDRLAGRLFGSPPGAATRQGALAVMGRSAADAVGDDTEGRAALGFLLAAPEMQLR